MKSERCFGVIQIRFLPNFGVSVTYLGVTICELWILFLVS